MLFTIYHFFTNAVSVYKHQFLKIFTLGFFFSCAASLVLLALIYCDFSIMDMVMGNNFVPDNLNEKIEFALQQKRFFPLMGRWQVLLLTVTKLYPVVVRIFYTILLLGINFFSIGFIRSLCKVYDRQYVSLQDLFFSYKAVLRTVIIFCLVAFVITGLLQASVYAPVFCASIFKGMIAKFITYICTIVFIIISLWIVPIIIIALYGALATEDSLWIVIRRACGMSLLDKTIVIVTVVALFVIMTLSTVFISPLIIPTYSVNQLILQTFFKNIVLLPLIVFVLFGAYKNSDRNALQS